MKTKANLFYVAASGWLLLLIIHFFSIAGIDVMEKIPAARVLYIVIFIVWVPAILQLKKNEALKQYSRKGIQGRQNSFGMLRVIFQHTPQWLRILAAAGFIYAFISFGLTINQQNPGQNISSITAAEHQHSRLLGTRIFSSQLMAFYGIAAAILYPFSKKEV